MKKHLLLIAFSIMSYAAATAQTTIYFEDFESTTVPAIPASYTELHTGTGNGWETHIGPTRWPMYDITSHTTYCIVNDYKNYYNTSAQLTTPVFSLLGTTNPHLMFDRFHQGFWGYETTSVEISTDGGASYTILDTLQSYVTWTPEFIDLSGISPTANCKIRFSYVSTIGSGGYGGGVFGFAIDNIKIYEPFSATDMGFSYITPQAGHIESYLRVGDEVTFIGGLYNAGAANSSSYYIHWQVGSAPPVSQYFPGTCAAYGRTAFTAFSIPYTVTAVGPQTVKLWIETIGGDANPLNDTIETTIIGFDVASAPLKRMFTEEITGTWCGWCPRGIVYLDSLWKNDSLAASIVSIHARVNQDGMAKDNITTARYDTFTNRFITSGYPSVMIDRRNKSDVDRVLNHMVKNKKTYGFADVGITQTTDGGVLKARAVIKPAIELSGDYRLELIVTEDEVSGTDWWFQQANTYATSTYQMFGCGYNFNDSASIIPPGRLKYRFVARWTIPENLITNTHGIAGSLPTELHANEFYTYNFPAVTIPANWNAEHLRCIAVLIDNNVESPNYGYVLNSATTSHPQIDGAPSFVNSKKEKNTLPELTLYPNPAVNELTASFTLAEANVTDVCIYDMLGRRIMVIPAQQKAGVQTVKLSTINLSAGNYTVMLRSGDIRETKMLTVSK